MNRAPPSDASGFSAAGVSTTSAAISAAGGVATTSGTEVAGAGADSSTFELVRVGESVAGAKDTSGAGAAGVEDTSGASTFGAAAFFAAAFLAGAFFAGASPSAEGASTFLTAAFLAAVFFAGFSSSGWTSRFSPSRSALRRTRSACASSIEDDTLRTSIPIVFDKSSASLFVSPSSLASSAIRIFLTAKG
jgi:hypothetical protein